MRGSVALSMNDNPGQAEFRQSIIKITLRKVLMRLHYPLGTHAHLRALVCGLSVELVPHLGDAARPSWTAGGHNPLAAREGARPATR